MSYLANKIDSLKSCSLNQKYLNVMGAVADEERSCVLVASADPIHIIGSSISKITCGTESQPWLLEAPAGQRLRISLLDFTASIGDNMGRQTKESCANYGVIIDKSAKSNISICGGGGIRDKEVYVSRGNEISLILTNVNEEKQLGTVVKRFLLAVASKIKSLFELMVDICDILLFHKK